LRNFIIDQHGASEIERCEEVEIRGKTQVIRDRSRDQTADKIARDIAGDVGGKGAAGVGSTGVT
jgi:hypothetical protein